MSDKDGKPKVHSIPDSSLVNRGGHSVLHGGRLGDCPQTSVSATDLSSRNFNDLPVFSLCHLSR